jgi:hypothetical protein
VSTKKPPVPRQPKRKLRRASRDVNIDNDNTVGATDPKNTATVTKDKVSNSTRCNKINRTQSVR